MNSNDLLAKLLANENLTIVRGNVLTASFDIGQRVLVLPQWKDMPEITEEMLILHEVGHALYTTNEYADCQEGKDKLFGHYLNVVEDARIERKMKQRYPGSRKSFIMGYKELNDRDFFKVKNLDLDEMTLIDRINLFYKAGMNCGVKFNAIEQAFINEIDRAETIKQVIDIAERVYAYAKETAQHQAEMEMLESIGVQSDEMEDADGDDLDSQFNNGNYVDSEDEESMGQFAEDGDDDDNRNFNRSKTSQNQGMSESEKEKRINDKMRASTVEALDDNLKSSADTNTKFNYYEPEFAGEYSTYNPFIGYKQVLAEMKRDFLAHSDDIEYIQKKGYKFREENNSIVNNMVKEFEMRKSASSWKRAQISKTGQLDPKKLFGYQIKDELFKQLTIVKNGKQHGMIFLLDWSGSMDQYLLNTIRQLINLAMFAKRINVPFQVFAFSSSYCNHDISGSIFLKKENGLGTSQSVSLLELFSNKMNEREMIEMTSYLLGRIWYRSADYSLSGTPLNEALLVMSKYVGKFIKANNVEKMIFITLTDGEGSPLTPISGKSLREFETIYDDPVVGIKTIKVKSFIKDPITGKQYEIDHSSDVQTRALLNIIRDRYNTINVGFNLTTNNYGAINRFLKNVAGVESFNLYDIQTKLRANRYYNISYNGYDKYYLVDNKGLDIKNEMNLDKVNSDMNANQVSKALNKVMNKNKSSRIILNNFVSEVA